MTNQNSQTTLTKNLMHDFGIDQTQAQTLSNFFNSKNAPLTYAQGLADAKAAYHYDCEAEHITPAKVIDVLNLFDVIIEAIQDSPAWKQFMQQHPALQDTYLDVYNDEIEFMDTADDDPQTASQYRAKFQQIDQFVYQNFNIHVHPYYDLTFDFDEA